MKLVSPSQRGTICQWRCPGRPHGRLALVQADIITLGTEHPIENHGHVAKRLDRFEEVRTIQLTKRPTMQTGGHQEVPVIIGISIQDHEGIRSTKDDEIPAIIVTGQAAAEETPRRSLRRGRGLVNILRCQGAQIRLNNAASLPRKRARRNRSASRSYPKVSPQRSSPSLGLARVGRQGPPQNLIVAEDATSRNGMSEQPARSGTSKGDEEKISDFPVVESPMGFPPDRGLCRPERQSSRARFGTRQTRAGTTAPNSLRAADDPRRDNIRAQARPMI